MSQKFDMDLFDRLVADRDNLAAELERMTDRLALASKRSSRFLHLLSSLTPETLPDILDVPRYHREKLRGRGFSKNQTRAMLILEALYERVMKP